MCDVFKKRGVESQQQEHLNGQVKRRTRGGSIIDYLKKSVVVMVKLTQTRDLLTVDQKIGRCRATHSSSAPPSRDSSVHDPTFPFLLQLVFPILQFPTDVVYNFDHTTVKFGKPRGNCRPKINIGFRVLELADGSSQVARSRILGGFG